MSCPKAYSYLAVSVITDTIEGNKSTFWG